MEEIIIKVPAGKKAEWVNGVLTLVDDRPKDIKERIKTFEDALRELGTPEEEICDDFFKEYEKLGKDVVAYLKLRVIAEALNEGWKPKFEKGEYRYYPWFCMYTQKEDDKMNDEQKSRCVLRSGGYTNAVYGFVHVYASYDASHSHTANGARLAFRTQELAKYAGRQFFEEWTDFPFKPRTGEELNGKSEATGTI